MEAWFGFAKHCFPRTAELVERFCAYQAAPNNDGSARQMVKSKWLTCLGLLGIVRSPTNVHVAAPQPNTSEAEEGNQSEHAINKCPQEFGLPERPNNDPFCRRCSADFDKLDLEGHGLVTWRVNFNRVQGRWEIEVHSGGSKVVAGMYWYLFTNGDLTKDSSRLWSTGIVRRFWCPRFLRWCRQSSLQEKEWWCSPGRSPTFYVVDVIHPSIRCSTKSHLRSAHPVSSIPTSTWFG
jgi:hypothetical protein